MKIEEKFSKADFQAQYDNWIEMNNFIKEEIYGKEITVNLCKKILSKFHSRCMDTTNKVCNLMLSLNVDSRGHHTGDKCEKCPLKTVCSKGNCETHIIYCNLAKQCLIIIRKREITNEEVMLLNTHVENLSVIETRDVGMFQTKSSNWGK